MTEVTWTLDGAPALSEGAVRLAVEAALAHGGRPGLELSVVFVGDRELAEMHAEHLQDPSETDVITFDLGEEGEGPAGELYVSVERARAVAAERGVAFETELTLYVVHGALHLCGHDDHEEDERRRMRRAELEVLASLGHELDRAEHERA